MNLTPRVLHFHIFQRLKYFGTQYDTQLPHYQRNFPFSAQFALRFTVWVFRYQLERRRVILNGCLWAIVA